MVLQSMPASSNVANFTFLWTHLSELRGVKFFAMLSLLCVFFLALFRPSGRRTCTPRSLIKVICPPFRLGPHVFATLIHGSVAPTAGGVARRSLVRRIVITILECTFPEENVNGACSGKTGAGQILVTSMFASIFLAWLASCYHW